MAEVLFRLASEDDAAQLLDVYAPYVQNIAISFEYEVPTLQEFTERIRAVTQNYPYLICEIGGRIAGYAYAQRQKVRAAYGWNAELSVYLRPEYVRRGIGRAFYTALLDILHMQGVENVYGCVTVPNAGSERLHEAMGFRRISVFYRTGYKLGAWHDVAWFEKRIGEAECPAGFVPVSKLNAAELAAVLQRSGALVQRREESDSPA